jgi:hypothetical protein
MQSENLLNRTVPLVIDTSKLLQEQEQVLTSEHASLFLEALMLLMFLLSAIYAILKIKRGRQLATDRIDYRDVESVLRDATKQCQHEDLPLQQDSTFCDPTTEQSRIGGRMGSGHDAVQLPGVVL